jgi:hypothetical protein
MIIFLKRSYVRSSPFLSSRASSILSGLQTCCHHALRHLHPQPLFRKYRATSLQDQNFQVPNLMGPFSGGMKNMLDLHGALKEFS